MIKIAIEANRAALDDITIPALGLIIDRVELVIIKSDPIKISLMIDNTLFLFKDN